MWSEILRGSGMRLLGETADGVAALELIRARRPQVALVGEQLPGLRGAAIATAVHDEGLPTRVLVVSANPRRPLTDGVVDDGVAQWLSTQASRAEIVEAVSLCAEGSSAWTRHHRPT
ncbi:DNA-binding NarL/FixJ family response regulator [Mycolicibacterium lutetiense]|uniref:DNA-binding NarL/FixJ family response regulator n=1 Tax=Mycolicibacterium lutetiense TaxID=1641992 RepID=A0ABS4ZSK5_9MYCO|nr:DNA-binding NarL/FixJ family response regulator [Mycolicibacterium lutetiense]